MVKKEHEICEGCQHTRQTCTCANPPKRTQEVIYEDVNEENDQ